MKVTASKHEHVEMSDASMSQVVKLVTQGWAIETLNGKPVVAVCQACYTPIVEGEQYKAGTGGKDRCMKCVDVKEG